MTNIKKLGGEHDLFNSECFPPETTVCFAEEAMYDALWESDRVMKSEREERECGASIQRNKDCLGVSVLTFIIYTFGNRKPRFS